MTTALVALAFLVALMVPGFTTRARPPANGFYIAAAVAWLSWAAAIWGVLWAVLRMEGKL